MIGIYRLVLATWQGYERQDSISDNYVAYRSEVSHNFIVDLFYCFYECE